MNNENAITRRKFLRDSTLGTAGLAMSPLLSKFSYSDEGLFGDQLNDPQYLEKVTKICDFVGKKGSPSSGGSMEYKTKIKDVDKDGQEDEAEACRYNSYSTIRINFSLTAKKESGKPGFNGDFHEDGKVYKISMSNATPDEMKGYIDALCEALGIK